MSMPRIEQSLNGAWDLVLDPNDEGKNRAWWDGSCGNTLNLKIDDEPRSVTIGNDGTYKTWHWLESPKLYNLAADIGEQTDVAAEHPAIAAALRAKIDRLLKETGARLPRPNPNYDAEEAKRDEEAIRTKGLAAREKQHAGYLDPNFKPNKDWWGSTPTRD